MSSEPKTIADVEQFWSRHPLFEGEALNETGSRAWFEEHERVYIKDCFAGQPPGAIFTAGLSPDARILDVGCGPGFWVRYFAKHGFRFVTACDLTARAVELTRSSIEQLGLSARIDIGNAEELPYGDATFDHVNCQGVVHHTPDPRRAVTEFRRVLRPEGTLCMSVYHRNFILRHPILVRIVASLLTDRVGLKGRGRERLLASGDATEIVRTYDGIDNPIGQAYTRVELEALFSGLFAVREIGYFFFPARALPIRVPRPLHRWLNRRAGLMIIARATAL